MLPGSLLLSLTTAAGLTIEAAYPSSRLPAGALLFVRGDACGLSWSAGVKMAQKDADHWELTLPSPPNGTELQFKALINDKVWAVGANAVATTEHVAYFPWFQAGGGRHEVVSVSSPTGPRDVVAWVPPSFDENPYSAYDELLVMSDGENVFNDSTAFGGRSWRAGPTLDDEIGSGRVRQMVVLAVDNSPNRIEEYTYVSDPKYGGGGASEYLEWLEQALPDLRARYRVASGARLNLLGSSLGGLLACYAAWSRPQTYSAAGCMSPSFWWDAQDFLHSLLAAPRPSGPRPTLYLDSGDATNEPDICPDTIAVRDKLQSLGWPDSQLWYYLDEGGRHNEASWGGRFAVPLRALFGVRRMGGAPGYPPMTGRPTH
jgi:predicted alpha/beta superfamily hydrolase